MQDARQGWQGFVESLRRVLTPRTTQSKQTVDVLWEQLELLKSQLTQLQAQSSELTTWQTGHAQKLESLESTREATHRREQEVLAKIQDLERRGSDIEAESTNTCDKLKALESKSEALHRREQELVAEIQDLERRSADIEAEGNNTRDRLTALEATLKETASRYDDTDQLIRDLGKELHSERKRNDANRHMIEERLTWVRNEQEGMHKNQAEMVASMRKTRRLAPVAVAVVLLLGMLAGAAMFRDGQEEVQEEMSLVSKSQPSVESPIIRQDRPVEEDRVPLNETIVVESATLEAEAAPADTTEPVVVEPQASEPETQTGEHGVHQPDRPPETDTAAINAPPPFISRQAPAVGQAFDADTFFRENASREGVVSLPSGLQYKVLKAGEGKSPGSRDMVILHYRGHLPDGRVFDDSYASNAPAAYRVNEVIPGWREALQRMREGAQWELYIPPKLAHGAGTRGVPAYLPLIYQIELISVSQADISSVP